MMRIRKEEDDFGTAEIAKQDMVEKALAWGVTPEQAERYGEQIRLQHLLENTKLVSLDIYCDDCEAYVGCIDVYADEEFTDLCAICAECESKLPAEDEK